VSFCKLSLIAYNLGNLWWRLGLPKRIGQWSLTSLQQRLVKTGKRLIKHARYYWLLLAESRLTWRLFGAMLQQIAALPSPTGQASRPDRISVTRQAGRRRSVGGIGRERGDFRLWAWWVVVKLAPTVGAGDSER
jgi:hypothetical protein